MKEWIFKYILRSDRMLHFFFGSLIFTAATALFSNLIALGIVTGIGIGKELYDLLVKKTKFDYIDLLYTFMLGALVNLIEYFFNKTTELNVVENTVNYINLIN